MVVVQQATSGSEGPRAGRLGPEPPNGSGELGVRLAAAFCILIATMVLTGWALGCLVLKAPWPDQVAMKVNAAASAFSWAAWPCYDPGGGVLHWPVESFSSAV